MKQSFYDYRNFAEISKLILISEKSGNHIFVWSATAQRMEK